MPEFKIENLKGTIVRVTDLESAAWMQKDTVEVILQFAILEKLEEIRCGLIDVEAAAESN